MWSILISLFLFLCLNIRALAQDVCSNGAVGSLARYAQYDAIQINCLRTFSEIAGASTTTTRTVTSGSTAVTTLKTVTAGLVTSWGTPVTSPGKTILVTTSTSTLTETSIVTIQAPVVASTTFTNTATMTSTITADTIITQVDPTPTTITEGSTLTSTIVMSSTQTADTSTSTVTSNMVITSSVTSTEETTQTNTITRTSTASTSTTVTVHWDPPWINPQRLRRGILPGLSNGERKRASKEEEFLSILAAQGVSSSAVFKTFCSCYRTRTITSTTVVASTSTATIFTTTSPTKFTTSTVTTTTTSTVTPRTTVRTTVTTITTSTASTTTTQTPVVTTTSTTTITSSVTVAPTTTTTVTDVLTTTPLTVITQTSVAISFETSITTSVQVVSVTTTQTTTSTSTSFWTMPMPSGRCTNGCLDPQISMHCDLVTRWESPESVLARYKLDNWSQCLQKCLTFNGPADNQRCVQWSYFVNANPNYNCIVGSVATHSYVARPGGCASGSRGDLCDGAHYPRKREIGNGTVDYFIEEAVLRGEFTG